MGKRTFNPDPDARVDARTSEATQAWNRVMRMTVADLVTNEGIAAVDRAIRLNHSANGDIPANRVGKLRALAAAILIAK